MIDINTTKLNSHEMCEEIDEEINIPIDIKYTPTVIGVGFGM